MILYVLMGYGGMVLYGMVLILYNIINYVTIMMNVFGGRIANVGMGYSCGM